MTPTHESTDESTADRDAAGTPDGSTNVDAAKAEQTRDLPDGTPSGDATEDPAQDSDTVSGGDPDGQ